MATSDTPRSTTYPRPTQRVQRTGQRPSVRENPAFGGEPWGTTNWPVDTADTAADITSTVWSGRRIAPHDNLTDLAADAVDGDGNLSYNSGANFTTGQFVYLRDGSTAHYNTAAWASGASA